MSATPSAMTVIFTHRLAIRKRRYITSALMPYAYMLLLTVGGLLVTLDGADVGALVLDPVGTTMYLRRFGVAPSAQGRGIARVLIDAAVDVALQPIGEGAAAVPPLATAGIRVVVVVNTAAGPGGASIGG